MSSAQDHTSREWLYQKYIVEGLGAPEIGELVGRDPKTILYWLRKHDIPTRPRGTNYKQNLSNGRPKGWNHTEETKEKVRRATLRDGRVPYLRNGQHFNKGKRGAVVHNWQGGITPERQTFYRSDEWKRASRAVWVRDDAKCRRCGLDRRMVDKKKAKFHVHHIVTFADKELRASPSNLVLLCNSCHYFVHSKKNVDREFLQGEVAT